MRKNVVVARSAWLALAMAVLLCAPRDASAGLCRGDDRVRLNEGSSFNTPSAKLSAEQVARIRRAVFALRPKIGLGLGPACTGTAISERLLLTAGHCAIKGGMKAYQKHLRPRPEPVDLKLVYRAYDKRSGLDLAIFVRKSGTFQDYLPVDLEFDFRAGMDDGDRYGFPAFPYRRWNVFTWRQKKLLFSPVSESRIESNAGWFGCAPCDGGLGGRRFQVVFPSDADPEEAANGERPPCCVVLSCADFFDGNSGSPMLRFHREDGAETMSVVAVGSVGAKWNGSEDALNAGAVPVGPLREELAKQLGSSK
jgi:hypothetical protein